MSRLAINTIIVLATLSVLFLLWQFRLALLLFALSLATAAAFRPPIDFIEKRGVPRQLALALTYLFTILLILGLLFFAGGPIIEELQQATDAFVSGYDRLKSEWPLGGSAFQKNIAERLPPTEEVYESLMGAEGASILRAIFGAASSFVGFASQLVFILILSLYWSIDSVRFERLWLSLLPVNRRLDARDIWRAVESGVGTYIRSEAIQTILAGLFLWLGYWSMGLPYPFVLAFFGALAWLIPWLGAFIAVIPPVTIALGISPGIAILSAFYTLLVLLVLEMVVDPRFFSRRKYSSLLLVIIAIMLTEAYGLVGLILAPPAAVALQIFFNFTIRHPETGEKATRVQELAELEERLAILQIELSSRSQDDAPEVGNLLDRLQSIIEKVKDYLRRNPSLQG